MKVYTKEYGLVNAHFDQWLLSVLFCRKGNHNKKDLGEGHPVRARIGFFKHYWCRSDNCSKCTKCGIESHD